MKSSCYALCFFPSIWFAVGGDHFLRRANFHFKLPHFAAGHGSGTGRMIGQWTHGGCGWIA